MGTYDLSTDAANDTANQDTHPALHNDVNSAVNDLDDRATTLESSLGGDSGGQSTDLTERLAIDEAKINSNAQGLIDYKKARDDTKVARMRAYYTGTTQQLTDAGTGVGIKDAVQFSGVHYEYPTGSFPGSGNVAWICLEEGMYQGTAHVQWAGGTGADVGYKACEIFVTFGTVAQGKGAPASATIGSDVKSAKVYDYDGVTPVAISMSVPFAYYFYPGDQVQVKMFMNVAGNSGTPKSQNISKALQYSPEFEIHKVGIYGQSNIQDDGSTSIGGIGTFTALPAPAAWYPTSPWNTPIGGSPTVDPNSNNIMTSIFSRGSILTTGKHVTIVERAGIGGTSSDYSHVVYQASGGDPQYVIDQSTWHANGFNNDIQGTAIYIPAGALPSGGTDFTISVIQPDGQWEYSLWGITSIANGVISCGFGRKGRIDQTGLGSVGPPSRGGTTAACFNNGLGVIRADELVAGTINHAIFCSANGWHGRRAPGVLTGGTTGQIDDIYAPPMGCRFQLDPAYATTSFLNGFNATPWKKTILTAMRDYGLYLGDFGGNTFGIHLESETPYVALGQSPTVLQYLDSYFSHSGSWDIDSGVDWSHLRVITYP